MHCVGVALLGKVSSHPLTKLSRMATPSSPALKRSQASRGHLGDTSPRRARRGSVVHFDEITAIFDDTLHQVGTLRSELEPELEDEEQGGAERCGMT